MRLEGHRLRAAMLGALLGVAGCYDPHPPAGAACSPSGDCPSGQMCVLGTCELPGTTHDTDAGIDAPIDTLPIDADLSCACSGNTLTCGGQQPTACDLGCNPDPSGARCNHVSPSNGLMYTPATTVDTDIVITADTVVDTDTGEINGAFHRDPGEGEKGGIIFSKETFMNAPLGVFWMKSLTVKTGRRLYAQGTSRSFVVITADDISVESNARIDVSAGCEENKACPGAGGGIGAYDNNAATGCAPGKDGTNNGANDSGGGGGGGGAIGGKGGDANSTVVGGAGGAKCMSDTLEPLTGGSGGGRGGLTVAMLPSTQAGGGGGGLQLTSNSSVVIRGVVDASGEGGSSGVSDGNAFGGGNGAGAGGGILLEAPEVVTFNGSQLGANGGGGGAGGQTSPMDGTKGRLDGVAAAGGMGLILTSSGTGGAGGAALAATNGQNIANGGGGGGSVGVIVVRALPQMRTLNGTISPAPSTPELRVR